VSEYIAEYLRGCIFHDPGGVFTLESNVCTQTKRRGASVQELEPARQLLRQRHNPAASMRVSAAPIPAGARRPASFLPVPLTTTRSQAHSEPFRVLFEIRMHWVGRAVTRLT
jgi:hypothetical protein